MCNFSFPFSYHVRFRWVSGKFSCGRYSGETPLSDAERYHRRRRVDAAGLVDVVERLQVDAVIEEDGAGLVHELLLQEWFARYDGRCFAVAEQDSLAREDGAVVVVVGGEDHVVQLAGHVFAKGGGEETENW